MSNIEALQETYGLLEHLVCELMVIFSGILCIVGIRHTNFKLICFKKLVLIYHKHALKFNSFKCYYHSIFHRSRFKIFEYFKSRSSLC